ncbi:hypothetical protein GAR06_01151 [Micromonospora saelicesensis]|uniref:Uncharacterized protein n=1 Tax=Micromonospora saelicesensis TaxID=285676 RepID=A0A1C4XQA5_9ACTN|nr:hypothetical protein GAR05_02313 [Micromonospora saelicesensis]RAO49323.1 hypothetical protein GAR06_01151 [Micromonospora saelicesensis]RAO58815.1 hypothetical protein PSN01_02840 [Micromonospora saelicesensis]RAO60621.1 hypothetical protein LUPAC06_01244 [Micromonospora saelicesensis]SCF10633.1 hypothetical protein GA0070561_3618 [Micromonospora saelicesensis]
MNVVRRRFAQHVRLAFLAVHVGFRHLTRAYREIGYAFVGL